MTAEVFRIGEPENESERMAIEYLRAHLPDSYKLFTNLEIKQGVEIFEIDFILLAPHCVYVVDIKNWHGRIEIIDPKWYPDNRQSYLSPLRKLRKHAKVLSSTIANTSRAIQQDLSKIHIQATVLITAEDVLVIDQSGTEGDHVTYLDKRCLTYFQSTAYIPSHRYKNIRTYFPIVERVICGKARAKTAPLHYRDWQVEDKLGGNTRYTEYRARNLMMGISGWTARLRVYQIDPFLEPAERDAEYKLISTAFQAVRQLPPHPHIISVQDFFASDDRDGIVLVSEDVPGQVLCQYIKKQNLPLKQQLAIIQDILHALDHAHKHGVIHRNITPDSILISTEGQARLVGFDYARIYNRTSTIADDIVEDLEEYAAYQAIECQRNPAQASIASDLFSAGLVFYELLLGFPAFEDANQINERNAVFPVKPSDRNPNLSPEIDRWLQKLCAFDPKNRFPSADAALQALTPIATLPTTDITNLPPDSIIDDRYRVMKRLGRPGSFAVAYQVLDTLGEVVRVLKLVTRDRRSVYERLQQEYKTLLRVPKHRHIVDVVWAGQLKDETPFIVFEYVDGQDVAHLIEAKTLSVEQAVQIARETACGLVHLHQHKVRHQDIKPSNLLVTNQGVRIIDFNVAVSDSDEMTVSAGTRRYMPPDHKPSLNPTPGEKVDRDLYALGITFYECITGRYPFDNPYSPIGTLPRNPNETEGCEDLSEELVVLMAKAIAPERAERFASAAEFLAAIANLPTLRKSTAQPAQNIEQPQTATTEQQDNQARFNLFDTSVPTHHQPNPDRPIVLDPTGQYEVPPGYIPITTEVEWMQSFGVNNPCWVKGKRLCAWAEEWLRVWNKTDAIAEIKQDPRARLATLFYPFPLPDEWTHEQLLTLAAKLDSYPKDTPIAHLLADIAERHPRIWLADPSIQHLATWLTIQVPSECEILERVWQQQFQDHDLATYYQTEDKLLLLRRWLGIAEPVITQLGTYPLPVPDFLTREFDQYWEQQLYCTEATVLDHLIPTQQPGMDRIALQAHKVLSNRPNWINKVRENKLSAYLSQQQQVELSDRQPPPQPRPLDLDASPQQALTWATESYLPFRRWEIVNQPSAEPKVSDRLADSFVEWMLQHYPEFRIDAVDRSHLNYSVTSLVQNLCQESPVLWVVVDGLSWLDHLELLSFLTRDSQLAIETAIQPRFSILPTKTEYAKWSLYAQLPPSSPKWVEDINQVFSILGIGRYTDEQVDRLNSDLRTKIHQLYCWDTERLARLYDNQRDWQNFYQTRRPHTLEGIAKEINYYVQQYPNPEELRIVIASDRGQMLGLSAQIAHCPAGLEPKGRMAIGKTDDPRFAVLKRDRYGLPHDISIVRGSASLGSFSYTSNEQIVGSHGGLFPEEVIVGVSVLRRNVQRHPVLVSCRGEGKPQQPGELEITIDNPNSVPLTNLCLYIKELPALNSGIRLEPKIPANDKVSFKVPIPNWPELPPDHKGDRVSLSGELTFRFANAEAGSVYLDRASAIVVKQMFSSGFDINEFF